MAKKHSWILPVIIFSQFAGTSLWFASNAVLSDLQSQWGLGDASLSQMTSSVQFGFIIGTLLFAYFTVADRYSPRKVYFGCSLLGALANLGLYLLADGLPSLLIFRFMTGFFLAGVYPVGMKIAAGSVGCIAGGLVSKGVGSAAVAFFQLLSSGMCCLLAPLMFLGPPAVFLSFLIFWGTVVVGDSPQFSALTAQTAPRDLVGSALTIVTSIGFFITIISIQLANFLVGWLDIQLVFLFLIPGPIIGLIYLWPLFRKLQKRCL